MTKKQSAFILAAITAMTVAAGVAHWSRTGNWEPLTAALTTTAVWVAAIAFFAWLARRLFPDSGAPMADRRRDRVGGYTGSQDAEHIPPPAKIPSESVRPAPATQDDKYVYLVFGRDNIVALPDEAAAEGMAFQVLGVAVRVPIVADYRPGWKDNR